MGQATTTTPKTEAPAPDPRREVWRFLLRFSLIAGVLLTAYYFPYDDRGLAAALRKLYLAAYAHVAGAAISLFDSSVRVVGTHIQGRLGLEFAMSCDAMDVLLLFAAATVAYPAPWKRRALGLGAAFFSIALFNIARVVLLYLIGLHAPARFELFHMQVFPLAIVILASLGFVAWTRLSQPSRGRGARVAAQQA
jgi:exosortase/archaeosortase family protein